MYLDHTFARKTFAQRIGSAKVKSKSVVTHCIGAYAVFGIIHYMYSTNWPVRAY